MSNSTLLVASLAENASQLNVTFCDTTSPIVSPLPQILYSLVFIIGVLGNTLVIYVVLRFSNMQTVTNMYILNLAIADECFLIGIPFLLVTMSLGGWIFGKWMCKVYLITTSVNQFTSSIFLLIMSADRYIAICHPISSPKLRTTFISRIVSSTAWITSAVFMIPVFLHATISEQAGRVNCNIYWPDDQGGQSTFTLYTFFLGFFIPLVLIFIFYYLVIRKLKTVGPKNKSKEKKRSNRKVTKLVLTVITVYVFCWLPYWLTQMALVYEDPNKCQSKTSISSFLLAGFLSYSNSAMNPILYAFLSDNFKKSFLKACSCAARRDANAALHVENSVLTRRNKAIAEHVNSSNRPVPSAGNSKNEEEEEENERGLLISKSSTTTITMTSRSNITLPGEPLKDQAKEAKDKEAAQNGLQVIRRTQV